MIHTIKKKTGRLSKSIQLARTHAKHLLDNTGVKRRLTNHFARMRLEFTRRYAVEPKLILTNGRASGSGFGLVLIESRTRFLLGLIWMVAT
jgi:hypothetical protein